MAFVVHQFGRSECGSLSEQCLDPRRSFGVRGGAEGGDGDIRRFCAVLPGKRGFLFQAVPARGAVLVRGPHGGGTPWDAAAGRLPGLW